MKITANNKHNAFTLAEVILVMLILGIVLSILVRTIIRVDPDKDKYLFLKSYNAVEAVVADSINDPLRYDQNVYTKAQLEDWEGEKHFDLSNTPLDTTQVKYIDDGVQKTACVKMTDGCNKAITQANALCYYLAEHINTIGAVNCDEEKTCETDDVNCNANNGLNFRTSTGVCFRKWQTNTTSGDFEAVIDPSCSGVDKGYAVKIRRRGSVTVPATTTFANIQSSGNQTKAYGWTKNPTKFDD